MGLNLENFQFFRLLYEDKQLLHQKYVYCHSPWTRLTRESFQDTYKNSGSISRTRLTRFQLNIYKKYRKKASVPWLEHGKEMNIKGFRLIVKSYFNICLHIFYLPINILWWNFCDMIHQVMYIWNFHEKAFSNLNFICVVIIIYHLIEP